jgi:transcriptional regulator
VYVPRQFREERRDVLARAVRRIALAVLVTPDARGVEISHVPMILKEAPDGAWLLEAHVARPNPHWSAAATATAPSVAIFAGPQAYVSPSWYATKREHGRVVPTWNYIAVHAHGMLEAVEDERWLHAHLHDLTLANEAEREHPWQVEDAPAEFIAGQVRAIVGLRLTVTQIVAAWKMVQHRSEGDRLGAIAGLEREPAGAAVADVMRELEEARRDVRP